VISAAECQPRPEEREIRAAVLEHVSALRRLGQRMGETLEQLERTRGQVRDARRLALAIREAGDSCQGAAAMLFAEIRRAGEL
jgi:transposase